MVATTPGLADIASEIGGDRVDVKSMTRGPENMHSVNVRPSFLVMMNKADLFIQQGLSLETAWIPELMLAARNRDIEPGTKGFVNAGEGWDPIQVPLKNIGDRRQGDVHPRGNPHINLDPTGGRFFAERIVKGLIRRDPGNREYYEKRHADYLARLVPYEKRWATIAERIEGGEVVLYHQEFDYLLMALGIRMAIALEPKPGIPPTPKHVTRVVEVMREREIDLILTASWSNNSFVKSVRRQTGAKVMELPAFVGGTSWATDWIAMMDGIHVRLAKYYGVEVPPLEEGQRADQP